MLKLKNGLFAFSMLFTLLMSGCAGNGSYLASYPSGSTYYENASNDRRCVSCGQGGKFTGDPVYYEGVYGKGGHDYYRDENRFSGGTAYYPKGANY